MHSKTVLSFINLSRVVLDLCNGQELKVQLNKGQLLQKYPRQSQSSCALHFPLNALYQSTSFIQITPKVLQAESEFLCTALSLNALYQSFIQFSVVFLDMKRQSNCYLP